MYDVALGGVPNLASNAWVRLRRVQVSIFGFRGSCFGGRVYPLALTPVR